MIAYLDTSARVKFYVRERGTAQNRRTVAKSAAVGTSIMAHADAVSE